MCGIAGIITKQSVAPLMPSLQQATRLLAHRGPEAESFWTNTTNAALGHCRLCIIDLSDKAAQPMHYADRYTLVFNGEIYNYLEIKAELEKTGRPFRSASDTEVILAAYAQWGPDCLQHFDGAFAFAIWDEQEQVLFGARDRFGEKPFFFHHSGEKFLFASEIKALWPLGVPKRVNDSLLYNFLTIGYTANPSDNGETFYDGISKLPAAHSFLFDAKRNTLSLQPYWQVFAGEERAIAEGEAIETFRHLFKTSIQRRLRSDVPVGTSLSGGLDSSAIVAFCHNLPAGQYTHRCFTASFSGFEKDETAYAAKVAAQYGLTHFTATVSAGEVPALMERIATWQDEPFSSASALAQFKVFELAKQNGVTVLLDGQGADEVLAGYHKYYRWHWQDLYRTNRPQFNQEFKAARALGVAENFSIKHKAAALMPEFAAALLQSQKSKQAFRRTDLNRDFAFRNKQQLYYATPAQHTLNGALHYNTFVNGLEELLRLADRNSMAHSVEVRLPYLQHNLVEFLFSLPAHFKIREGWTKWLLRTAVTDKLPAEITWRRDKVGFEPPQQLWMQNKNVQEQMMAATEVLVRENILSPRVLRQPIVPAAAHAPGSLHWRYWSAAHLFH